MGSPLLLFVGLLRGEKQDGVQYTNRTKFHKLLKKEIKKYTQELKYPKNSKLRKNFIKNGFYCKKRRYSITSFSKSDRWILNKTRAEMNLCSFHSEYKLQKEMICSAHVIFDIVFRGC
jgi:hypothetical protein